MEDSGNKKSKKKGIITALFFVFSLAIVAVIAFREFGGQQDRHLDNLQFQYPFLACAIGCFLVALFCESMKYKYLLRRRGYTRKKNLGFSCAVIGKYYDNLTPAGAGGQGFQMYYLTKNGCDSGTAGSLPIIGFLGLQFAFVLIAILTLILGRDYIGELVVLRVTAIAGVVFYAFVPTCIIFFAIAPRTLITIVCWGTKMLGKIHILKHPEQARAKAIRSLRSYTEGLRAFWYNRKETLIVFGLSLVYQIAFMIMPYFVLRFFGSEMGFIECFCKVVYIYAAITIVFTPGNSGAAEASFYLVFESLPSGAVFWGMLVWRGLCYYSWIVLGVVMQLRERRVLSGEKEKDADSPEEGEADPPGEADEDLQEETQEGMTGEIPEDPQEETEEDPREET